MHLTLKDFLHQQTHKRLQPNNSQERFDHRFDIVLPFREFENELYNELVFFSIQVFYKSDKLIITEPLKSKPIYAQDWWPDTQFFPLEQHADLKKQPYWGSYYHSEKFKHEKQIRESIKNLEAKRIDWKIEHPFNFRFYSWTVVEDIILYCLKPSQRFPMGWHEFNEDKTSPPNRAYLKLWEIFLIQDFFEMNEIPKMACIEVGCSPGGWTWVLAQHFKKVYAIDKAPLGKQLNKFKNIDYQSADAFKLDQKKFADARWFFSDIICTPERMNELVSEWIAQSQVTHFVSTIKFKGEADFKFLQEFQKEKSSLGQSLITHLYHNKNEVTWLFKKNKA